MPLLTLLDAQLAYGDLPLLDRATLAVEPGERIGLIGRNGTGKSSLLAALEGRIALDDGEVRRSDGLRIARVEQEPTLPAAPSLRAALVQLAGLAEPAGGATGAGAAAPVAGGTPGPQAAADEREPWRQLARLDALLDRFGLDGGRAPATASGGERKRAALALALARGADLLLLDEPTNHLDLDAITVLETLLTERGAPTLVVITHDRAFLDRVATRIVELDRGVLRSYPGNFAAYQARKADQLAAESLERQRFDKFWAQEEVWIRKGVEARRTRNAGRVRRLEALRVERAARRERQGQVRLALDPGERSGRLVAELDGVLKRFGERTVVRDLSLRLMRGDRLGLIGPNGAGKSTLIRLILGELPADAGTIRRGTAVQAAYFDQLREVLDPERTVADTIAPGSDWVEIAGQRKHVIGYLGDFLFPPRRAQAPVKSLSGGERNRLLLARLFARPANLLVLDEPTNDLDIESLELLEDTLLQYPGTLILVSHDRAFLDHVVTHTLAPLGDGRWQENAGGYAEWLAFARAAPAAAGATAPPAAAPARARRPERAAKLSFKESRELAALPAELEALEREREALHGAMADPGYHRHGAQRIKDDQARLEEIERQHDERLARWVELESRAGEG